MVTLVPVANYLITGVSRGIGRAAAERLLADGHQVYGTVRTEPPGLPLAGFVTLDLAEPAAFDQALAPLLAQLPALDGVVHAAGIVRPGPLADTRPADFTEQFTVNVTAVAELTRCLLPALRAAAGTVLLVNSGSGLNARPPLSSYGAAKHALRGYADALRQEEPALRVCSLYPGRTDTEMQRAVRAAESGEYQAESYLRPETVAGVIATVLALPRDATITDLTLRPAT